MSEPTWENIEPIPLSTIPGKPDVWGATRNGHIEELEARTLNLRGRAQSLEQRYLQGSGIPEGVVTASPGALYSDTAVTRGAALWRKATGTGNTGWRVAVGDTGRRNVTSLAPNLDPANTGQAFISRRGTKVTVELNNLLLASGNGSLIVLGSIPADFRPLGGRMNGLMSRNNSISQLQHLAILSGDLYWGAEQNAVNGASTTTRPTIGITGAMSWEVPDNQAWPSSLPGTPA